jgi:hypothetical protein
MSPLQDIFTHQDPTTAQVEHTRTKGKSRSTPLTQDDVQDTTFNVVPQSLKRRMKGKSTSRPILPITNLDNNPVSTENQDVEMEDDEKVSEMLDAGDAGDTSPDDFGIQVIFFQCSLRLY